MEARIILTLALALAASGCRPSDLCSEPTRDPCGEGCSAIPVQRDNGDCLESMHFCIAEFAIVQPARTCLVDPQGVAYLVSSRFALDELFGRGWRTCESADTTALPTQSCTP